MCAALLTVGSAQDESSHGTLERETFSRCLAAWEQMSHHRLENECGRCHQSLWRWWKLQVPSADQGIGPVIFKGLFEHVTICRGKWCRCNKTLADLFYVNRICVFAKAPFDRTSWLDLQRSEKGSITCSDTLNEGLTAVLGEQGKKGDPESSVARAKRTCMTL